MSLESKHYGTEKEPVRSGDLGALTGCALAWQYGRQEGEEAAPLRAQDVLEASAREALFKALREGLWEADAVEKLFRDAYRRRAKGQQVDWEGRDPKQEGRAFLQMLKNFLPEARRRVASALAIDAGFTVSMGGVKCAGSIDLLYRDPVGKLCLAKLSFERRRRSQWMLDHDPELALQGAAVYRGEISADGKPLRLAAWPDRIEYLYLRDFLPLRAGMRIRIEHPDQVPHFSAPLWSMVVLGENMLGPAFYGSRQSSAALPRLEFSLKQFVAAVKGGRIVETFGDHCRFCPFQSRCLGEGSGVLSRKEQEVIDKALTGISTKPLESNL
jgi:hypothetical protein